MLPYTIHRIAELYIQWEHQEACSRINTCSSGPASFNSAHSMCQGLFIFSFVYFKPHHFLFLLLLLLAILTVS